MTERNKDNSIMTAVDLQLVATFHWNESLGNRLRNLRENKGLSRKALSEETKKIGKTVSESYIQQLESPSLFAGREGKSESLTVSKDVISRICEAMSLDVTDLLPSTKLFLPNP
jgi:transcriptional regulator with XRE-family HTH domain